MEFISDELSEYVNKHTQPESALLQELNRETYAKVLVPRMLSGHLQGRVLAMFSKMIKPSRILEIGTYTGYSALCLAEGLTNEGELITIDINEELTDMVQKYVDQSDYKSKIKLMVGDAIQIIPGLPGPFDLVFIDADKTNYINYYNLVFDKLNPGGYIIADNVLWSGNVLKDPTLTDDDTKALVQFNENIQNDSRIENVLFPVRDGLMVVRKV